ncbi:MAG: hypothetical protein KUG77_06500, partial [Nannocystaceae bacterium]|nr:hypothetical protein [Nannocystaceae bacterium]
DGDGGDKDCPTPGCSSYAAQMIRCYPQSPVNWYAECVDLYDTCGAWECLPGTAQHVSCINSHSCEMILDNECNALDRTC